MCPESTRQLVLRVQSALNDSLRRPPWRGAKNPLAGHCYVACEVLFHLLEDVKPMFIRHEGAPHWFLLDTKGQVIDPTASQFSTPVPYHLGKGKGFLTKKPSKRALDVLRAIKTPEATSC